MTAEIPTKPGPLHYRLGAFPPGDIDWTGLTPLLGQAHGALARYDGMAAALPNADVLLSPLTTQEAALSSRIEGTNVTLHEVLEIEAGSRERSATKLSDAEEVANYRDALSFAAQALDERPLSLHVLREAHALLMDGVRGRDKSPGSFRSEQNWIGSPGASIEEASFVPIAQEHLSAGLDRWADYMQSTDQADPLVQLAVTHAEFEALHPFQDGNGRLGRMLIPLFLYGQRILKRPNFYMSAYLEAKRDEYLEGLLAVSRDGAWTPWCAFFLQALTEQANDNQRRTQSILDLYRQMQQDVADATRSQYAGRTVEFLFSRPVFTSTGFAGGAGIPKPTAARILARLRDEGILRVVRQGARGRPAMFAFQRLLDVVEAPVQP